MGSWYGVVPGLYDEDMAFQRGSLLRGVTERVLTALSAGLTVVLLVLAWSVLQVEHGLHRRRAERARDAAGWG